MKGFFKTIWLTAVTLVIMTATSCSSEADYFGLDEVNETFNAERVTRASFINCSEYLTISSYDISKWSDDDFNAFSIAAYRIGVSFSKTRYTYVFEEPNGEKINISDSLYNCVIEMYERTNSFLNSSSKLDGAMTSRMKSRATESNSGIEQDCVPAAIAHMKGVNVGINEIKQTCDTLFPGWRAKGIDKEEVGDIIRKYIAVNRYYDMSFCKEGSHELPNYVVTTNIGQAHTANAFFIRKNNFNSVIFCHDYSSSSNGDIVINELELYSIYVLE